MICVTYSSNNSGGSWWLKDEHWLALEAAGWKVDWYREKNESGLFRPNKDGRWLGALASEAHKEFETPADAIREWESVVGKDASDEGCNCCGPPHCFTWGEGAEYNYASGEQCLEIIQDAELAKLSKRELIERLKQR